MILDLVAAFQQPLDLEESLTLAEAFSTLWAPSWASVSRPGGLRELIVMRLMGISVSVGRIT